MRTWQLAQRFLWGSVLFFAAAFALFAWTRQWWSEWLYYIAQAALIGSVADWFAVMALFTKPLGIPFHTALIPRQREKLIRGLRQLLEEKLLRRELWEAELNQWQPTNYLAQWWRDPEHRRAFWECTRRNVEQRLPSPQPEKWARTLAAWTRQVIGTVPMAATALAEVSQEDAENVVWQPLRKRLLQTVATPAFTVRLAGELRRLARAETAGVTKWVRIVGEATGMVDYDALAQTLQTLLQEELRKRDTIPPAVLRYWSQWQTEWQTPAHANDLLLWQRQAAALLPLEKWWEVIGDDFAEKYLTPSAYGSRFSQVVADAVLHGIDRFFADTAQRARLDRALRGYFAEWLAREHGRLGEVAEQVLSVHDEKMLNRFIFTKVADELAKIRINGAYVGAVIGALAWLALTGYGALLQYL